MSTDLAIIVAELRRLSAAVEALHAAVHQALNPSALRPAEAAVVDALGAVFGAGAVTTREILEAARQDFGDRPALRAALQALAPGLRAQPLGIALATLADKGGAGREWTVAKASSERGSRVWVMGHRGA